MNMNKGYSGNWEGVQAKILRLERGGERMIVTGCTKMSCEVS